MAQKRVAKKKRKRIAADDRAYMKATDLWIKDVEHTIAHFDHEVESNERAIKDHEKHIRLLRARRALEATRLQKGVREYKVEMKRFEEE